MWIRDVDSRRKTKAGKNKGTWYRCDQERAARSYRNRHRGTWFPYS